jgi:16S rRNA G966 N2-methylase RsmD
MDWKRYCQPDHWHEAANLFPILHGTEFSALVQDIRDNGLQNPVVLFDDKVLDGRNRLRACARAERKPSFIHWHKNGVSPLAFVVAQNLKRRQLTIDQRAAIAAELVPTFAEEAKKRPGGRPRKGEKPPSKVSGVSGESAHRAARFIGSVSATYVRLVLVLEKKKPGMLKRIKAGQITIREAQAEVDKLFNPRPLREQYVVPPFSVLDAGHGEWIARKKFWLEQGVREEREHVANQELMMNGLPRSLFDPVLCECIYGWFAPKGGHILDPFAGEPTMGLVAAFCGHRYIGIELRTAQVRANNRQASKVQAKAPQLELPTWVAGDSAKLNEHLPAGEQYDLVFCSPPYFNLETYSKNHRDGSTFRTYEKFMEWYEDVFRQAAARLKENRFLVVKLGEVRDQKGFYRNFVGESISCFHNLGLRYYNTAILYTGRSTSHQRVRKMFPNYRKLVATHQHILCFWKGSNPKLIPQELGVLDTAANQGGAGDGTY